MNKIAIVFWSGTGNTEAMAGFIAEGVRAAGGEAELLGPGEFSAGQFSAYSWGDGQWMRDWYKRCDDAGANLLDESGLTVNEAPDPEGEEACRELGRKLAAW